MIESSMRASGTRSLRGPAGEIIEMRPDTSISNGRRPPAQDLRLKGPSRASTTFLTPIERTSILNSPAADKIIPFRNSHNPKEQVNKPIDVTPKNWTTCN